MKSTSKSYSENIEKNTTQWIKNAYELNNHEEKMILQYLKVKINKKWKNREIICKKRIKKEVDEN